MHNKTLCYYPLNIYYRYSSKFSHIAFPTA
uniref:Uncharacterized protein n=1 Tax=Siphoviridae sp. ctcx61 TaxID=2825575 RepID=A0A8S5TWQ9_9CAUD|nr:MAG TPA: hypothetical protein [Siphoviridae sp. ctcx61]